MNLLWDYYPAIIILLSYNLYVGLLVVFYFFPVSFSYVFRFLFPTTTLQIRYLFRFYFLVIPTFPFFRFSLGEVLGN